MVMRRPSSATRKPKRICEVSLTRAFGEHGLKGGEKRPAACASTSPCAGSHRSPSGVISALIGRNGFARVTRGMTSGITSPSWDAIRRATSARVSSAPLRVPSIETCRDQGIS